MVGRNTGLDSANSIMMRSTNSTALGFSRTICCAESIAVWKLVKLTTPSTRLRGRGTSLSVRSLVKAKVPSDPTKRCARFTPPSLV